MIIVLRNGNGYLVASDLYVDLSTQLTSEVLESDFDICIDNCEANTILAVHRCRKYSQLLKYGSMFKLPKGNKNLTMKYVVNAFVPIFKQQLEKFNYIPKNKFVNLDKEIILVKKNIGYLVGYDTGVMQIGDEELIGNGAEFAYPILRSNYYIKDPVERILDVYKKSKERFTTLGKEIVIFDSVTLDSKFYNI